jgi:hypothetical protein
MGLVRWWWWHLLAGAEKPPKSQAAMKLEGAPSFSPSIGKKKNGMDSIEGAQVVNAKLREEIELTEEGSLGTARTSFCLELWGEGSKMALYSCHSTGEEVPYRQARGGQHLPNKTPDHTARHDASAQHH